MGISSKLSERPASSAKQVAGRLCLDFVNMVGGWLPPASRSKDAVFSIREDRLTAPLDLVAWALRGGLVSEAQAKRLASDIVGRTEDAMRVLKRAQRLRAAIHSIASSIEQKHAPPEDALNALSDEISRAWSKQKLAIGRPNLTWVPTDAGLTLESVLAAVALSAEDFFTTGDLTRLHTCPGDECGWLFEDTTRNRSRRWCDMGDCGNKAKVRDFRSRQSERDRSA